MDAFQKFSHRIATRPFQKHLFFLGLAVIATAINGYHFGTFDQVFHLTFLKKFINPQLYPNDPFLDLRWYHFSFFWFLFIPLFKAGWLEISMFLVHILTVYGTIWMFWELADVLFQSKMTNLLLSLALVFPHLGFPGFQIVEFSLLNRTFVLPFLLASILLYLQNKKGIAFFLLGVMFNLHVIYALFVLCMFLWNEVLSFQWKHGWKLISNGLIFFLAALPVLIWRNQTGSGIDFTLRPDMLDLTTRGLLHTVYYPIGWSAVSVGNFLAGIGTFGAFLCGYQRAPKTKPHRTMRNFTFAIGMLILIGSIVSYLLPVTILVQLQLLRAGVFMLYFGMLYLSYAIIDRWEKHQLSAGDFLILSLSFVLLVTPLITVLLLQLLKKRQNLPIRTPRGVAAIALIEMLTIWLGFQSGLWSPGLHINGPQTPWREIQEWAKQNTASESMFITPPHLFGHYIPDWRVFSERATVATIPEMMEIPFDPDFSRGFEQRFNAVAPGALDSFDGNYLRSLEIAKSAYDTNDANDFIELACEFSAMYLIVEKSHPYPFEIAFQNREFILYNLPGCPTPLAVSQQGNHAIISKENSSFLLNINR